jgi:hypothetical protein
MSSHEKLARHEALHKVVTTHTSHTWAAVLVKMLLGQLGGKVCSVSFIFISVPRATRGECDEGEGERRT